MKNLLKKTTLLFVFIFVINSLNFAQSYTLVNVEEDRRITLVSQAGDTIYGWLSPELIGFKGETKITEIKYNNVKFPIESVHYFENTGNTIAFNGKLMNYLLLNTRHQKGVTLAWDNMENNFILMDKLPVGQIIPIEGSYYMFKKSALAQKSFEEVADFEFEILFKDEDNIFFKTVQDLKILTISKNLK